MGNRKCPPQQDIDHVPLLLNFTFHDQQAAARKAFHETQETARKAFHDSQKAARDAFRAQQEAAKAACPPKP